MHTCKFLLKNSPSFFTKIWSDLHPDLFWLVWRFPVKFMKNNRHPGDLVLAPAARWVRSAHCRALAATGLTGLASPGPVLVMLTLCVALRIAGGSDSEQPRSALRQEREVQGGGAAV